MTDAPTDMVAWIYEQSHNQTVVNFLSKAILNNRLLAAHLTMSAPGESNKILENKIHELVKKIRQKGLKIKYINLLIFWLAIILLFAGTMWPLIDFLWLKRDGNLYTGVVQFALLVLGGATLGWYRHWKIRQTEIEDTLRLTLFAHETIDRKIRRLSEALLPRPPHRFYTKAYVARIQWWFANEYEVRKKLSPVIEGNIGPDQLASIATQLKDAGIKDYAISMLIFTFTALAVVSIAVGLVFPGLISAFNLQLQNSAAFQSLFVVGFGGLFLALRRQYIQKRTRLHIAAEKVFTNRESLERKQRWLIEVLREIDIGPNPGEIAGGSL
jgi:hypothetical protein